MVITICHIPILYYDNIFYYLLNLNLNTTQSVMVFLGISVTCNRYDHGNFTTEIIIRV